MEYLIKLVMTGIIVACTVIGYQAVRDLNDGRVNRAVAGLVK